jgi:hypothetical protein
MFILNFVNHFSYSDESSIKIGQSFHIKYREEISLRSIKDANVLLILAWCFTNTCYLKMNNENTL